jgi:lipopolysaccharide/colanic/teichoic acid biosynthesis glycosyltransferase
MLALLVTAPALALIAASVWMESGLPILFCQTRIGRGGRPFRLLKFRTMRVGPSGLPITASGDSRITRIGGILRRYKLDELLQLWNVLRGEMALVGPRPEVPEFVDPLSPVWRIVLSVLPGVTDLATILYRNEERLLAQAPDPVGYYREQVLPRKLALNVAYLRRRSLRLDLKLIFLTVCCSLSPGRLDTTHLEQAFAWKEWL